MTIPTFTIEALLARLGSFQQGHPKYTNFLRLMLQPHVDAGNLAAQLPSLFDLDTAVGVQLDAVGERVGQSRIVRFPLVSPYFSWDSGDPRGWDRAPWRGPYDDPYGYGSLDDDTYRRLLRARIKANKWDGSIQGAQDILNTFFNDPATLVIIEDKGDAIPARNFFSWDDPNPNRGWDGGEWEPGAPAQKSQMRLVVVLSGKIPPVVDLALLDGGYVPPKPAAIAVDYAVTSVSGAPVFGFDMDNQYVGGWDRGAWGISPELAAVSNYT